MYFLRRAVCYLMNASLFKPLKNRGANQQLRALEGGDLS